jgi:hypothetical protein
VIARASRVVSMAACAALVAAAPASAAVGRFPPPAAADRATVWAVGDGAFPSADATAVAGLVRSGAPTRFLYLGDVYETGTAGDFARGYAPIWGPMRAITLPTPGNHEWGNRAVGYDRYWGRVTGGTPPPYYAVSMAGWKLISANSETDHGPRSAQVRWLRSQLAGSGTCRIVFWHRPRYSGALHGDAPDIAPLWNATLGRARLVLNGHDHDMQRMRPVRGVTQLISGAGGHYLYPVDSSHPRLAWSNDRTYGAVRLDLSPGLARYSFVSSDGRTLDTGTVRCRAR